MTNHIDFDEIGKKTPYRIPEGFFDEMQEKVLQQVEKSHDRRPMLKQISYAVIGMAAAVAAFVFIPHSTNDIEQESASISWVEQVSDEDLKAMADIAEYDIFMD